MRRMAQARRISIFVALAIAALVAFSAENAAPALAAPAVALCSTGSGQGSPGCKVSRFRCDPTNARFRAAGFRCVGGRKLEKIRHRARDRRTAPSTARSAPLGAEQSLSTNGSFVSHRIVGHRNGEVWAGDDSAGLINRVSPEVEFDYYDNPALSPDGEAVVYDVNNHSLTIDAVDGAGERALFTPANPYSDAWQPSWHPSGRKVLFTYDWDLYVIGADGNNLQPIAATPDNYEQDGAFSPDGSTIAFSDEGRIGLMDSTGQNIRYLTAAHDYSSWGPRWSPDGSKLVFYAFTSDGGSDIFEINEDGTGLEAVSETAAPEQLPDYAPDGKSLIFDRDDDDDYQYSLYRSDIDGGNAVEVSDESSYSGSYRQPRTATSDEQLLSSYAPRLIYAASERSPALSPASITDNVSPTPPPGNVNQLCIAAAPCTELASPIDPVRTLSLNYLGGTNYATGEPADATHYIAERGSDGDAGRISDGQRLYALPAYGNRVYGRVVEQNNVKFLQYWFFYYFNYVVLPNSPGQHEGDWEMIQVRLSDQQIPTTLTYARHANDEAAKCDLGDVEKTLSPSGTIAPSVYVADGTHASYFRAGSYGRGSTLPSDDATGDGFDAYPALGATLTGAGPTAQPAWAAWPGMWGGTVETPVPLVDQPSPRGPLYQGSKTSSPEHFENQATANCDDSAGRSAAQDPNNGMVTTQRTAPASRVAAPRQLTAVRRGNAIRVSWRLEKPGRARISVRSLARDLPGQVRLLTGKQATTDVALGLPDGGAPYEVSVRGLDQNGNIGAATTVGVG